MINPRCVNLTLSFWLGFFFFSEAIANPPQTDATPQENRVAPTSPPQFQVHQEFIVGFWRGFHQAETVTVYYGYQFRPDGTFFARHRVYQDEKSIQDETWQGQWEFAGDILRVKGFSQKKPPQLLKIQFRFAANFQLYYQDGSLSAPYIPMSLSKTGASLN